MKSLSIRLKLVFVILGSVIIFSFLVYIVSTKILLESYIKIEEEQMIQNLDRVNDAVQNNVFQLGSKLSDWAWWDDTYKFIQNNNLDYVKSNLGNSSIANIRINAIVFLDLADNVVFKKVLDFNTKEEISSEHIATYIEANSKLSKHTDIGSVTEGIISIDEGVLMVSSKPILTSEVEGPIAGTLLFGKFIDEEEIVSLSELTHLTVKVYPYNSPLIQGDLLTAKENLSGLNKYFVKPVSSDLIRGYTVVNDIQGEPVLIFEVESTRRVYNQGQATFYLFIMIAVIGIIIFGAVVVLFVEMFLTSPFIGLIKEVQNITKTGDLSLRIKEYTMKEVGSLAATINDMIERVSLSKDIEMKSSQKTKEALAKLEIAFEEQADSKKAIINLIEDVKEEKNKAEDLVKERTSELRQEKARLLASINSLSLGFIMADMNDKILLKNPAIIKILGLDYEPTSLQDIAKLFTASSDGVMLEFDPISSCRKCMLLKSVIEVNNVFYGKKFLRIICAPISTDDLSDDQTDNAQIIGYVFLVEDVTEAKVNERSRDEFFAVASHELRTPLTAIRGNTDMILDAYAEKIVDKDMKEMLADINTSSIRLIGIVNDFLEVSRLEQGKIELHKEKFNINEVVSKVVRDFKSIVDQKKIYLEVEYLSPESSLPKVFSDKSRIEQVLVNLVGNAVKFTKEGGIKIKVGWIENFVIIHIVDTGVGISIHNQVFLFRKFQQAGEQMLARDITQSTGLGLYICKLLISALGGTIDLEESNTNKGSTFTFTIPSTL